MNPFEKLSGWTAVGICTMAIFAGMVFLAEPLPAQAAMPFITSISPTSGPQAGGTVITVTGSNLSNPTFAMVGTNVVSVTPIGPTQVRITSPASLIAPYSTTVIVYTAGGSSNAYYFFTYLPAACPAHCPGSGKPNCVANNGYTYNGSTNTCTLSDVCLDIPGNQNVSPNGCQSPNPSPGTCIPPGDIYDSSSGSCIAPPTCPGVAFSTNISSGSASSATYAPGGGAATGGTFTYSLPAGVTINPANNPTAPPFTPNSPTNTANITNANSTQQTVNITLTLANNAGSATCQGSTVVQPGAAACPANCPGPGAPDCTPNGAYSYDAVNNICTTDPVCTLSDAAIQSGDSAILQYITSMGTVTGVLMQYRFNGGLWTDTVAPNPINAPAGVGYSTGALNTVGSYNYRATLTPGSSSCLGTVTVLPPSGAIIQDLLATPSRVQKGHPTSLSWEVSGMTACWVTGTDGFRTSGADDLINATGGVIHSAPATVNQTTAYLLWCNDGNTTISGVPITVGIVPVFQEI